jgi:hypothetical protein
VPSTFRKAQKYNQATPNQSSTLSPPNSATALTSLLRAGQTFQQATQVQPLGLCPNQGWSRHRPNKLANTRQNPAFAQLSRQWVASTLAFPVGVASTSSLRNLCRRLAGGKPAVDLGMLEMLTCVALSHAVYSKPQNLLNGKGEVKFSGEDTVNACAELAADACGPRVLSICCRSLNVVIFSNFDCRFRLARSLGLMVNSVTRQRIRSWHQRSLIPGG